jgi:hypothetical protein
MNLADMADFICAQVRYTDSRSIAKCKEFIQRRDEMVYNDQLWRQSIRQLDVTYDPENNTLHAQGIYMLPRAVDRVLGARTTDNALFVRDQVNYFQIDPDEFAETGTPVEFFIMPRAVHVFASATDIGLSASVSDEGGRVFVRWIDDGDEIKTTPSTFAISDQTTTIGTAKQILDYTKVTTNADISIIKESDSSTVATLQEAETSFGKYTPLRLIRKPTEETVVKVLFKMKHTPMESDYDESDLPNIDNVLIAFASGDMLRRARRYGQAKEFYGEGQALLEQLKKIAIWQEANQPRIIPDVAPDGIADFQSKGDF